VTVIAGCTGCRTRPSAGWFTSAFTTLRRPAYPSRCQNPAGLINGAGDIGDSGALLPLGGKLMRAPAILIGLVAVAACAAPAVISDINDSAIKIQVNAYTSPAEIDQRAQEGCGIYNKQPVPISQRCLDQYCVSKELLFACKDTSVSSASTLSGSLTRPKSDMKHGAYDGKWTAESAEDACGLPWAMQIDVHSGEASGMLWRGKLAYNFVGSLSQDGRLEKILAGKTESSNGLVGPRFITVNAAFQGDAARGDYSMPASGVGTCVVSFNLSRHQA
jgi:hypothetical protein